MKAPLNWLAQYVEIKETPEQIAADLTMSGSKVETIDYIGEDITNVVVGKILSIEKHENAEKLVVCMLEVGKDAPVQIVTGAKNISVGDLVPVALNGAILPNNVTIKTGELRGVKSYGMLCSHQELGLTDGDVPYAPEHGILILRGNPQIGIDIRKVLGLDDYCIDFEITSNRPDCLSITGLARELAVTYKRNLHIPKPIIKNEDKNDNIGNYLSVKVDAPELCLRYAARIVKDIKIKPSPDWMRIALRNAGVRPINNIVDITNYVMLEYGQPMHAFDYAFVKGGEINVRKAKPGETITTLDDIERKLDESMLVICDKENPSAVAGVMGGEFSGINENTKTIVFESANFFGPSIRVTARHLGMRTESSGRYEKGLDPMIVPKALSRACNLIEELGAGVVVSGVIDINNADTAPYSLPLRADYINKFLGTNIDEGFMTDTLSALECKVENGIITVPSFRRDLRTDADIAEEIARFYGYDKIPTTLIKGETIQGGLTPVQLAERKIHEILVSQGLYEVVTYSFMSPKEFDKINLGEGCPFRRAIKISNPLGEDTSIMRTMTIPTMLEALAFNYKQRNISAALYEIGTVYLPNEDKNKLPEEKKIVTVGFYNNGDFFDLKGIIEELFEQMGITDTVFVAVSNRSTYHPGRCARIFSGDKDLGTMGEIHPIACKNFGVDVPMYVACINFDTLISFADTEKIYHPLPKFPAVTRDIALLCNEDIPVASLENCIKKNAGALLETIKLFDVYKGKQIENGKKSVAFALVLRDEEKTLNDSAVEEIMSRVIAALQNDFNAVLRL